MSDTWDTGTDTDVTQKPRPPSPRTLRKIFKLETPTSPPPEEDDDEYRPTFTCSLPTASPPNIPIHIVPVKGPPPIAEYTLTKHNIVYNTDSFEFWVLEVLYNGDIQCQWEVTDASSNAQGKRVFRAYSYTWVDDRRLMGNYTNPFTGKKELGWAPRLYGNIVFGHEWKKKPDITF